MPKTKIYIAIPSVRDWESKCGHNIAELTYVLAQKDFDVNIDSLKLSLLSMSREKILNDAAEWDADYLLCIDDDMPFRSKAVLSLLSRDKDVVAANAPMKIAKHLPVAMDMNNKRMSSIDKTGIEEASAVSFAFCLLKVSAFENIPSPRFEVLWNYEAKHYTPEDAYFSRILREHGIKLFVDHDASQSVFHAGSCYHTNMGTLAFADNTGIVFKKPDYFSSED